MTLDEANTTGRVPYDDADPEVDHPIHYNAHPSGIECIDLIRGLEFTVGTAIKYLWRAGLKGSADAVQDLEKAIWYLSDRTKNYGNGSSAEGRPAFNWMWARVIAADPDPGMREIWTKIVLGDTRETVRLVKIRIVAVQAELEVDD